MSKYLVILEQYLDSAIITEKTERFETMASGLWYYTIAQSQNAVTAYFTSKPLLPFDFTEQSTPIVYCR